VAALQAYQANSKTYIDRARTLLNLAAHASSEESRSEFMLLASLYQELAQRRARLAEEEEQTPVRAVQPQALAN
jgi:hypothetical protein